MLKNYSYSLLIVLAMLLAACGPSTLSPTPIPMPTEDLVVPTPTLTPEATGFVAVNPGPRVDFTEIEGFSILNQSEYPFAFHIMKFRQLLEVHGVDIPVQLTIVRDPIYVYNNPVTGCAERVDDSSVYSEGDLQMVVAYSDPERAGGNDYDCTAEVVSVEVVFSVGSAEAILPQDMQVSHLLATLAHEIFHVGRYVQGDCYLTETNSEVRADGWGYAALYRSLGHEYSRYQNYIKEVNPYGLYLVPEENYNHLPVGGENPLYVYLLGWNE